MPSAFLSSIAISCLLATVLVPYISKRRRLPPGPRGWPVIGNLLDIPSEYEWLFFSKLKEEYGAISSLSVPGKTIVILNTYEVCRAVLDQSTCSNRPTLPFAGQLVGWDQQLIMSPYNTQFRLMRRLVFNFLGTKVAAAKYQAVQEQESLRFASAAMNSPGDFVGHLRASIGAMVLRMSHGYLVKRDAVDPLTSLIGQCAKDFYIITKPGRWLVDLFPSLRYIPAWVPGASFKKEAEIYRQRNVEQTEVPYEFVLKAMAEKKALPSMVSQALASGPLNEEEVHALKHASLAIYGGGLDTIIASVSSFIMLMLVHPHIQRKVQLELDDVVGTHRVPSVHDLERLPYFAAVHKEVMRYHPIGPVGIPHEASEDVNYLSYSIPKGTLVIGNIWRIAHDEENYVDPMTFNPDRFLSDTPPLDPGKYVYGFGRRICPGVELAQSTVAIIVATCLSLFNVVEALDHEKKTIPVTAEFLTGTVSHPKPFECSFQPRSPESLALIDGSS